MKIEIRETKTPGLIQITTLDERWYRRKEDGRIFASSSWISKYSYKGKGFETYLKQQGENADEIMIAAGNKGNRVHQAIDTMVARKQKEGKGYLDIENETFQDRDGEYAPLNGEECEAVYSFVKWWHEIEGLYTVDVIDFEKSDYNEEFMYAGTRDLRFRLALRPDMVLKKSETDLSGTWTLDYKTSQAIYTDHIAQISSYQKFPDCESDRLGILQIGYRKNKKGYKFNIIEPRFDLFLAAMKFWELENADKFPKQFELPQLLNI